MINNKYQEFIESQNGKCNCPQLRDLIKKRENIESLIAKCDFLKDNVDLINPRGEDRQVLTDYRDTVNSTLELNNEYCRRLQIDLNSGNLKLRLHNEKVGKPLRYVTLIEAKLIQELHENPLLTAHCSNCEQQIEII